MGYKLEILRDVARTMLEPLLVGYPRGRESHKQDGYISSLMVFSVLFSFGVAATFGRLLSSDQSEHIRKSSIKIGFTLYLVIGTVFLVVLVFSKKAQRILSNLQSLKSNGGYKSFFQGRILRHMPIFALATFGIGVLVIDLLQISAYGACVSVYDDLDRRETYNESVVTVMLHLVRPIFCGFIIVFAIRFPRDQVYFYQIAKVRYLFVLIISALFWVWLDAELHHAYELYEDDDEDWSGTGVNCTGRHTETYRERCLCKNTDNFRALRNAGKYIYPLNIEFCLLAFDLLFHYYFMVKSREADTYNNAQGKQPIAYLSDLSLQNSNPYEMTPVQKLSRQPQTHDEQETPLEDTNNMSNGLVIDLDVSRDSPMRNAIIRQQSEDNVGPVGALSRRQRMFKWGLFGTSVTICLGHFILSLCVSENFNDKRLSSTAPRIVYFLFLGFYYIFTSVIVLFGFRIVKTLRSKPRGYRSLEMLILACTFALYIDRFLAIIAAVSIARGANIHDQKSIELSDEDTDYINDHRKLAAYEIFASIMNIIQIFIQTPFIFRCLSLTRPASKHVQDRNYRWYKQILLYMIPMNGVFWIVNSFTIINLDTLQRLPSAYFNADSYQLISHLVFPFALFYRFNSCITCVKLYFDT